ncbi:hypothetical protein [Flavobacterium sp. CF136]|uniref:hypothetical protein n=1 Tax=Flavobacterium sp. (strain CF136) TaxID=1144313 RepID=UPI0002715AEE|nr:hypothetical protein [Flavobacterium sp. CF136]EJL64326.1 hypothetical protein PMI10_02001 [Flavobacterium sp. CF136]
MDNNKINYNLHVELIREKIRKRYFKSSIYCTNYREVLEVENSRFKNLTEVSEKSFFNDSKVTFIKLMVILTLFLLFVIFDDYDEIYRKTTASLSFWAVIFLLTLNLFSLFGFVFKRKSVCIKTTNDFLIINSRKKVAWKEILTTGIFTIPQQGLQTLVIIGTIKKIFTVNCTDSELSAEDLIQIINLHKNAT